MSSPAYRTSEPVQGTDGKDWTRTDDVRHTKEDALSPLEFERMHEATYRLDDDYWALECRLVLFLAGRLGMRGGEIAHMTEEWVDWERKMIVIPTYERCTDGRDGGICGHCKGAARQMAATRTENRLERVYQELDGDADPVLAPANRRVQNAFVDPETFHDQLWSPKTENASREIPFESMTRARLALEDYFERYDAFMASRGIVNRRVKKMAKQATGVDPDSVYPHALRSTAATAMAGRGLDAVSMKSFFGWSEFSTALNYIEESGERTAEAIRNLRM